MSLFSRKENFLLNLFIFPFFLISSLNSQQWNKNCNNQHSCKMSDGKYIQTFLWTLIKFNCCLLRTFLGNIHSALRCAFPFPHLTQTEFFTQIRVEIFFYCCIYDDCVFCRRRSRRIAGEEERRLVKLGRNWVRGKQY